MANDPIHQFQLTKLIPLEVGGVDVSFTNSALFMVASAAAAVAFLMLATGGRGLVPSRAQSLAEMAYEFNAGMLRDAAGVGGMKYFPLIFTLFMFILMANMFGMFPYFFTATSHIIVTAALALIVFATVLISGLYKHGFRFFKLFVPSGVPMALMPLVIAIEVISFIARPISHSVRLFANMLAGHITLKVFAGFVTSLGAMGALGIGGAILPLIMTVALTALEFLVAFVQAYVFVMLSCMYINDALHPDSH